MLIGSVSDVKSTVTKVMLFVCQSVDLSVLVISQCEIKTEHMAIGSIGDQFSIGTYEYRGSFNHLPTTTNLIHRHHHQLVYVYS